MLQRLDPKLLVNFVTVFSIKGQILLVKMLTVDPDLLISNLASII